MNLLEEREVARSCSFRRIVVETPGVIDIEAYRVIAKSAARAGATHITVSGLHAKSRWEIEDPSDPYLQWGIKNAAMFKLAVPEALDGIIPRDFADKALSMLRQKSEIAAGVGLGRAYSCREPHCWPESLYERHPHWRGPRVDHPRRTRRPCFALCVDNPEVLDMYHWAARQITQAAGGIDVFMIGSNDSGSGLCWAEMLYNNPNGPSACRHRHIGQRVGDLLSAILNGAAEAGSEAKAFFRAQVTANERALLALTLPANVGLGCTVGDPAPSARMVRAGPLSVLPVIGIPLPFSILESLEQASRVGAETLCVSHDTVASTNSRALLMSRFLEEPTNGPASGMALLERAAEDEFGADAADEIVGLWDEIHRGVATVYQVSLGGTLLQLGVVAQRWLTRPLVPFPAELSPQERDYYRRFQFQANTEAEANDILNSQAVGLVSGRNQAYFLGMAFDKAAGRFRTASRMACELAGKASSESTEKLMALSYRLRALACLVRTCSNMVQFQTLLDDALPEVGEAGPQEKPWILEGYGDRQKMYDVVRAEVDNTQDLIDVIEQSPAPVLEMAAVPAEEDTFTLGPDLVEQLRRKIRITMQHWLDFNRLYARPNR